ncbi:Transcriptional regulatory protein BasR [Salmonella enterica subsp. enterica]|uniref:Transcriptional regulatory protein BasR n=1 Tax=Salmonella enterica I TaxID=59201 RepID=A0A379VZK9_SALET|nr:Transcriptional regulatory protein BasR [Salmonella enterica subsp. enterica]
MKILIVEDDTLLLQGLILAAQTEGYACDGVSTARAAEHSLESGHYSLMVLDLGLPDEDGLHFLTRIRQKKYTLPVLILTARDTLNDRITGWMSAQMIIWLNPSPWRSCTLASARCCAAIIIRVKVN